MIVDVRVPHLCWLCAAWRCPVPSLGRVDSPCLCLQIGIRAFAKVRGSVLWKSLSMQTVPTQVRVAIGNCPPAFVAAVLAWCVAFDTPTHAVHVCSFHLLRFVSFRFVSFRFLYLGCAVACVGPGIAMLPGLLHFVYMWDTRHQCTRCQYPARFSGHKQRKRLLRAYQRLFVALRSPHPVVKQVAETGELGTLVGVNTPTGCLLACFDRLFTPAEAYASCERLIKAVRRRQDVLTVTPAHWPR